MSKQSTRKSGERLFSCFLLVVVGIYLIIASTYNADARNVPVLVGGCTFGLLVIQLVVSIRKSKEKSELLEVNSLQRKGEEKEEKEKGKRLWILTFSIVMIVLFSYFFGLIPILSIFIGAFLFKIAKKSILVSTVSGILTWVVLYTVFVKLLVMPVSKGIIIEALIG